MKKNDLDINNKNGENISKRKVYLDALKCLAICLVVVGHIDGLKIGVNEYETLWGCVRYTFQMPLFFFISGLFASHGIDRGDSFVVLLWNKIKTLLWPALLFETMMNLVLGMPIRFPSVGTGYYWFTFTLFECFFIYYLVANLLKSNFLWRNIVLAAIAVFFVCILALKWKSDWLSFVDLNHLTKYFQYFFVGTLFALYPQKGDKIIKNQTLYALCVIGFVVLMFFVYKNFLPQVINNICRDIVLRYLALYIVFALFYNSQEQFNNGTPLVKVVGYIGRHSLEIYLLHFFFLPTLLWLKMFKVDDMFVLELPISLTLSTIVIAIVLVLNFILSRNSLISKILYGK